MKPYQYILAFSVGSLGMYFLESELSKTTSQLTAISSAAVTSGLIAGMLLKNNHWLVGIVLGIGNVLIKFSNIIFVQNSGEITQILSPSLTIFVCTFLSCIVIGLKKRKYEELESENNPEEPPSLWTIFLFFVLSSTFFIHYFFFPYSEEFYTNYPLKRYTEPLLGIVFSFCTIRALFANLKGKNS